MADIHKGSRSGNKSDWKQYAECTEHDQFVSLIFGAGSQFICSLNQLMLMRSWCFWSQALVMVSMAG